MSQPGGALNKKRSKSKTSIIVGVVSNTIITQIQTRNPKLVYETIDTIPFEGVDEIIGIYHVVVNNEGKSVAKDVTLVIIISNSVIRDWKISINPAMKYVVNEEEHMLSFDIENVNPLEEVSISVLASSNESLPRNPTISLRGEGLTGIQKSDIIEISFITYFLRAFMAAALVFLFILTYKEKKTTASKKEKVKPLHKNPTQIGVFLSLSGFLGLNELFQYYSKLSDIQYWAESDRLTTLVLNGAEDRDNIYLLLKELVKYPTNISSDSKAIIYYNLARLAYYADEEENTVVEYLNKAKEINAELVEYRLSIDPLFKSLTFTTYL